MPISRSFARWFPVPSALSPIGTGVDVSDSSIKWLTLVGSARGARVKNFGTEHIPEGVVQVGTVRDPRALAQVLGVMKKKYHVTHVHAALPEEAAFVFSMHVPEGSTRGQTMNMIEFELVNRVPLPPADTVYDFDTVSERGEHGEEIAVTVFPRELAEGYVEAFKLAGIELLSLEIEARSIARAISGRRGDPVTMLVDCGRARTGVAILKQGIPIFTSTVEIGGDQMTEAVTTALALKSEAEAEVFKNEHGLVADDPALQKGYESLEKVANLLAAEIARHYRFWDTRRGEGNDRTQAVERVYLLGGSANLKGFPEYIAGKVQAEAERPNVWRNLFAFDDYIPPIPYRGSFQYATAIGLALRSL
jgi:type IV pilus assembly protein PilM